MTLRRKQPARPRERTAHHTGRPTSSLPVSTRGPHLWSMLGRHARKAASSGSTRMAAPTSCVQKSVRKPSIALSGLAPRMYATASRGASSLRRLRGARSRSRRGRGTAAQVYCHRKEMSGGRDWTASQGPAAPSAEASAASQKRQSRGRSGCRAPCVLVCARESCRYNSW